jgi:hypothetical protein
MARPLLATNPLAAPVNVAIAGPDLDAVTVALAVVLAAAVGTAIAATVVSSAGVVV